MVLPQKKGTFTMRVHEFFDPMKKNIHGNGICGGKTHTKSGTRSAELLDLVTCVVSVTQGENNKKNHRVKNK